MHGYNSGERNEIWAVIVQDAEGFRVEVKYKRIDYRGPPESYFFPDVYADWTDARDAAVAFLQQEGMPEAFDLLFD